MKNGYVYQIIDPAHPDSLDHGYIGVVVEHRGVRQRFIEHKNKSKHMKRLIKEHSLTFENHVKIICYADIEYCYELEIKLRPKQKMGWNLASGGRGQNYTSSIENLRKIRSQQQKLRMQNEDIKKKQSENFKINYYSNKESQVLRKQRSKEHMSDPVKKEKCLSAIHKKIKCPHCDYENNAGNIKLHIKRKHEVIECL